MSAAWSASATSATASPQGCCSCRKHSWSSNPGGNHEDSQVWLEAAGDPAVAGIASHPVGADLRGQPLRVDLSPTLRHHLCHGYPLRPDGTLPLAGGRQHAARELRPVPPAPPGRCPGDPVGGRSACPARVYKIVTYSSQPPCLKRTAGLLRISF